MNKEGNRYAKTSNIVKQEKRIRLLHRKLANTRNNHIHQVTSSIVKTKPSNIVIEDLNVSGMMKNKHLSKAIAEQKLHDFKVKLSYKCEKNGIVLVEADRWFPSSKMCSSCGILKKDLKLSDRVYVCSCGLSMDRDLNASINLSRYGKQLAI
jgi:putative transposase